MIGGRGVLSFIISFSGDAMFGSPMFVNDNVILLALHDVSPRYEDAILHSYDRLMECGVSSFTLLATPMFEMKGANTFERNELFSGYITSLGLEIALHGLTHFSKSGSIKEFHGLPHDRMIHRLKTGIVLLKRGIGINVEGFVPPSWVAPSGILQAAKKLKLKYCVNSNSIYSFIDDNQYIVSESFISQGTRDNIPPKFLMEVEFNGPVQMGIHPLDYSNNAIYNLLLDVMDRLNYKVYGYLDYLRGLVKKSFQ